MESRFPKTSRGSPPFRSKIILILSTRSQILTRTPPRFPPGRRPRMRASPAWIWRRCIACGAVAISTGHVRTAYIAGSTSQHLSSEGSGVSCRCHCQRGPGPPPLKNLRQRGHPLILFGVFWIGKAGLIIASDDIHFWSPSLGRLPPELLASHSSHYVIMVSSSGSSSNRHYSQVVMLCFHFSRSDVSTQTLLNPSVPFPFWPNLVPMWTILEAPVLPATLDTCRNIGRICCSQVKKKRITLFLIVSPPLPRINLTPFSSESLQVPV